MDNYLEAYYDLVEMKAGALRAHLAKLVDAGEALEFIEECGALMVEFSKLAEVAA